MPTVPSPLRLVLPLLLVLLAGATPVKAGDADVALAKKARASVVRIRWRDARFSRSTAVRNAIVIRSDGLLLMAGAPLPARGTLTALLADGRELPAELVASDLRTALSLLRVRAAHLPALALRREPVPASPAEAPEKGREPEAPRGGPGGDGKNGGAGELAPADAEPSAGPPRPLGFPPLGLRVVMVTSDGSVAMGAVRAHRRYGRLREPRTRRAVSTTGLVGAAIAAVDQDVGAPLLDPEGRVVGLMVGRKAVVAPEAGEDAAAVGLRLRPEPRSVVAVPADVIHLVWPLLERFRRIPRAALGVGTLKMDDALRAQLDLDTGGHVVKSVEPGSPADRSGLELHDVIVGVDGRRIEPGTSLHDVLLPYRPGMPVKLDIFRAGDRVTSELVLQELR